METSVADGECDQSKRVEALVYKYQARIRAFLFSRTGDADVADDLAQEVFLVFLKRIDKFDASQPVWPWLVGIARNKLREHWRSRPREIPTDSIEAFIQEAQITSEEADNMVEAHEQRLNALRVCIAKLAPASRKLLQMTYEQRMRSEDVAIALRRKAGAIRVALCRVRSWLAGCIQKCQEGLPA